MKWKIQAPPCIPQPSEVQPLVGGVFLRARIYARILSFEAETDYTDDGKQWYVMPKLKSWATDFGVNPPAITKHIDWLEAHGFIRTKTVYLGKYQRRKIWVLVRPKIGPTIEVESTSEIAEILNSGEPPRKLWETLRKRTGNAEETPYKEIKGVKDRKETEHGVTPERADAAAKGLNMALNKSLDSLQERLKEKQEASRARARARPPAPKTIAHEWNRVLSDYGHKRFDPNDGKHLAHIKKTIRLFGTKTTDEFLTELESRIAKWVDIRPKALGKAPPHPWAINRTDTLVADLDAITPDDELEFTDEQKELMSNPIVQEAVDMSVDKGDNGAHAIYKPEPWKPGSKWIKDKKE